MLDPTLSASMDSRHIAGVAIQRYASQIESVHAPKELMEAIILVHLETNQHLS